MPWKDHCFLKNEGQCHVKTNMKEEKRKVFRPLSQAFKGSLFKRPKHLQFYFLFVDSLCAFSHPGILHAVRQGHQIQSGPKCNCGTSFARSGLLHWVASCNVFGPIDIHLYTTSMFANRLCKKSMSHESTQFAQTSFRSLGTS